MNKNFLSLIPTYYIFLFLIEFFENVKVNSMEIYRGNKMPLAFSKLFEARRGCTEIQIPNNYKKLILKLNSNNLDRVLVTDMKIDNCNEKFDIKSCCSKNATFCMENSFPTQNEFYLNYCIDYIYIYACVNPDDFIFQEKFNQNEIQKEYQSESVSNSTGFVIKNDSLNTSANDMQINDKIFENTTQNNSRSLFYKNELNIDKKEKISFRGLANDEILGNIKVDTDIKRGEGCTTAEYLSETECSTIGLANCRDQTKCDKNCVYVECRHQLEDPRSKIFSMCLPSQLRDSDIDDRCKNHIAFRDTNPQPFKITCTNPDVYNYIKKESSHTFFKFILVIFGVFLLTLFISSIYYRYHCSNYKNEPFEPPYFCPNFVYPRASAY